LAGMTKIPWPRFLLFNLTGSAVYSVVYILLGYFFGKKWKILQAWLGPTVLYAILAVITVIVFGIIFRHTLSGYVARFSSKGRK
jgi:membrane-associated protein